VKKDVYKQDWTQTTVHMAIGKRQVRSRARWIYFAVFTMYMYRVLHRNVALAVYV